MKNKQHKYILKAFLESSIPMVMRRCSPELMAIDSIISGYCAQLVKRVKFIEFPSGEIISKVEKASFAKLINQSIGGTPAMVKKTINEKVSADAKVLNLHYTEVESAGHVPKDGNWVVALAYATDGTDYHWWRRNEDGTWSHKPGSTPIVHWDASGRIITDPGKCNRGIYDGFLGYYEVGPN